MHPAAMMQSPKKPCDASEDAAGVGVVAGVAATGKPNSVIPRHPAMVSQLESRRRSVSSSSSDRSSRRKHSRKRGKSRKHSKHSKRKHKHKSRHSDRSKSAVDQAKFGKYGVINAGHFFEKQRVGCTRVGLCSATSFATQEFEAWCREVKNINNLALPKTELKEIFGSFIEDYNTATMPHEK